MYKTATFHRLSAKLSFFLCLLFAGLLLAFPSIAADGVKKGLGTCFLAIIPSLFPFMFSVDYLFSRICANPKTPAGLAVGFAILFGVCGGFPMGAKALSDLVSREIITRERASALLAGLVNAGPAYLISGVGLGLFGNVRAGILLFVALSSASLICIAISTRFIKKPGSSPRAKPRNAAESVETGFSASMRFALQATLSLCAYVVFFSCIGAYISLFVERIHGGVVVTWFLNALCEVANGCAAAAAIGSRAGLILAGVAVSLCSISILMQVRGITRASGISLRWFFLLRPLHLCLVFLFLRTLIPLFPAWIDVYANALVYRIYSLSPLFSIFFILVAVIFILSEKQTALFTKR
jgi:hypothetical protein